MDSVRLVSVAAVCAVLSLELRDGAQAAVTFTDVTETALPGIATAPGQEGIEPSYTGGGTAGDCDGDGRPDLYFTGARHDVLYRNRGDGTFEDVTVAAGLGAPRGTRGAAFGDVDNDGDLDLYATAWADARHFLYVNDGTCRFTEEAADRGVAVETMAIGRSASFGDYDRDGYLDLFVTELQSDLSNPGVPGPISHLFRNRGQAGPGTFEDVTVAAGVVLDGVVGSQQGTFPFAARFSDLDADGWPDLAIAADFRESRLFWNDGGGGFFDGTVAAGVGTDEHGMGGTTADLDGDGRLDLFVTSVFVDRVVNATGNRLYRNDGARAFVDVTDAAGVRNAMWGWGTEAFDYDNDGDLDLIATNGASDDEGARAYVQADLGDVDLAQFANDPLRLWENDGSGVFTEVSAAAGISDLGVGQGVLTIDFDDDGDVDVLLLHDPQPPNLWRNEGATGAHWLALELEGVRAPRNGIGARVTLTPRRGARPLVREVSASSTYLAQDGTARLHFGLGSQDAPVRVVQIRWSSGRVQTVKRLEVDMVHGVTEETSCRGKAGKLDPTCIRARAERRCIGALNAAGADVAAAAEKRLVACVADHRAEDSTDACLASDPGGRIAEARARAEALAAERCAEPPSFGPVSATDVGAAMTDLVRILDLFGPSLDAALVDPRTNPSTAACQLAVTGGLVKLARAQLRAFNRCKTRGLAREEIASTADLLECAAAVEDEGIAKLAARLGPRLARRCDGIPLATALPGACAGTAPESLVPCLREQSTYGLCLALNAADRLGRDCDG